jgi:hypothetical protein
MAAAADTPTAAAQTEATAAPRAHEPSSPEPSSPEPSDNGVEPARADTGGAGEDLDIGSEDTSLPLVRVISDASRFAGEFLPGLDCEVELLSFRESRLRSLPPARVLVVDMRPPRALADLARLIASEVGAEPIVLLSDVSLAASAYALGARAVIPDQPEALAGYVGAMLATERSTSPGRKGDPAESQGFVRLREIIADLRDSAPSATRILGLLRVASDFAQRAAVFVVLGDQIRVIGAFGRSATGRPLADVLRKAGAFALDGALREAAESRAVVTRSYDETLLPRELAEALGPPANHRFLVVPVTGGDKVILLVYLDNEDRLRPIEGLDVIELAGAHIGLMFENELLKRRFGISGRERREPTRSSGSV